MKQKAFIYTFAACTVCNGTGLIEGQVSNNK